MEPMGKKKGAIRVKMEEDIKRAEKFIVGIKECGLHDCSGYKDLDIESLEKLIKGYRELEEENNKFRNGEMVTPKSEAKVRKAVFNDFKNDLKNYIPKSKVISIIKDIQEKTGKLFNTTYVPSSSRIYNDNKERYEPMLTGRTIAMEALKSLQELMEDK